MLRSEFASQIVEGLGSSYEGSEDFLVRWMTQENTTAEWNPLATTQPARGANDFNGVGVKNYPDAATGVHATVQTLTNGLYPNLVNYLTSGAEGDRQALNHEVQRWSGSGYTFDTVESVAPVDEAVTGPDVPSWYTRELYNTGDAHGYMHGADVERVQEATDAEPKDAIFGPNTQESVVDFQTQHGLQADGIVGPITARAIGD